MCSVNDFDCLANVCRAGHFTMLSRKIETIRKTQHRHALLRAYHVRTRIVLLICCSDMLSSI